MQMDVEASETRGSPSLPLALLCRRRRIDTRFCDTSIFINYAGISRPFSERDAPRALIVLERGISESF